MANPPNKGRTASLHDAAYANFVEKLVRKRIKAGFTQQSLADALGWNQSIVAKIESVQRRLDIVELAKIANILQFDAGRFLKEIQADLESSGKQ